MTALTYAEIEAAAARFGDWVRRVVVARVDQGMASTGGAEAYLAVEFMQHTGTFKARSALNFIQAHRDGESLPEAGVTIASGGNAGLACAWAARDQGVRATVLVSTAAPPVKIAGLERYGADVRLVGSEYAEALAACQDFAATTGALMSHAYDHPLIAAGAGTLLPELPTRFRVWTSWWSPWAAAAVSSLELPPPHSTTASAPSPSSRRTAEP